MQWNHVYFPRHMPLLAVCTTLLLCCWNVCNSIGVEPELYFRPNDRIAIVGNTFADLLQQHGYFETQLRQRFVLSEDGLRGMRVRNYGWAGDSLTDRARPASFSNEDQSLTDNQTDVIIACFGMGESFAGERGLAKFQADLRRLLSHYGSQTYNGESAPRLILISPIAHEDVGLSAVNVQHRNEDLASYTQAMAVIAKQLQVCFIDLFVPTRALMQEKRGSRLTTNGIHLSAYGQWAVSQLLIERLAPAVKPLIVDIDVSALTEQASGGAIVRTEPSGASWGWSVSSSGWPAPPAPPESLVHPSLERFQDRISIRSLPPGMFRLDVGPSSSLTATAEQWAAGVVVNSSPRHLALEEYREAINSKNKLFFHGWRALNQVHIVGERKGSPSGQALPAELDEWLRLGMLEDERLANVSEPSRHEFWSLQRIP